MRSKLARWPRSGRARAALAGLGLAGAAAAIAVTAAAAPAGTTARLAAAGARQAASPAGFWSGTDSTGMTIPGPAPFKEPVIGGPYGGYIGMLGNWAAWQHCGGKIVWSGADAAAAVTDLVTYHQGIGAGVYWFMAGPGVDPRYNGRAGEAYAWGQAQAARVLQDLARPPGRITYPVVFMDVEIPGHAPSFTPAPDNGWNSVYTAPCSGRTRASFIAPQVDRAVFNGFAAYLTSHSTYRAGVYSSPAAWRSIFGTGTVASVPNTYEWTYAAATSSLARHPAAWCLAGTSACAQFFGGMTSSSRYALMWQWSGGGGTFNGHGDFDQIDGSRTPPRS